MYCRDMLNTWDQVFQAMGGPAEVGRAIGKTTEHAAAMQRRGRIPSAYWWDLAQDAKTRGIAGVTYEALCRIDAGIVASVETQGAA